MLDSDWLYHRANGNGNLHSSSSYIYSNLQVSELWRWIINRKRNQGSATVWFTCWRNPDPKDSTRLIDRADNIVDVMPACNCKISSMDKLFSATATNCSKLVDQSNPWWRVEKPSFKKEKEKEKEKDKDKEKEKPPLPKSSISSIEQAILVCATYVLYKLERSLSFMKSRSESEHLLQSTFGQSIKNIFKVISREIWLMYVCTSQESPIEFDCRSDLVLILKGILPKGKKKKKKNHPLRTIYRICMHVQIWYMRSRMTRRAVHSYQPNNWPFETTVPYADQWRSRLSSCGLTCTLYTIDWIPMLTAVRR